MPKRWLHSDILLFNLLGFRVVSHYANSARPGTLRAPHFAFAMNGRAFAIKATAVSGGRRRPYPCDKRAVMESEGSSTGVHADDRWRPVTTRGAPRGGGSREKLTCFSPDLRSPKLLRRLGPRLVFYFFRLCVSCWVGCFRAAVGYARMILLCVYLRERSGEMYGTIDTRRHLRRFVSGGFGVLYLGLFSERGSRDVSWIRILSFPGFQICLRCWSSRHAT